MTAGERARTIEAHGLTKRNGDVRAVDDVTFTVRQGAVTGFLGRNGAGKSTTMRMIVGLHRPSAGSVTVSGHAYRDLPTPLREIGVLLDAKAVHPGLTARDHLQGLALSNGLRPNRVGEVLELAGIGSVADRRVGTFSLGMGQRLGIAAALLGDPPIIMLDEPLNGLDPDGVLWLRTLLRELADQGRTVFFSSHLMSEMELVADRLIVLDHGRLIADTTLDELLQQHSDTAISVRVKDRDERDAFLRALRRDPALTAALEGDGAITVRGIAAGAVGALARDNGIGLSELTTRTESLEDIFMSMTATANTNPGMSS